MLTIKQSINKFYIGDIEKNPIAEVTYVLSGEDTIIDKKNKAIIK